MSFTVPTFNLECNVYTGPWLTRSLRLIALPCNLALGRRTQINGASFFGFPDGASTPSLLVPAKSDVRDDGNVGGADVIECPLGSGRWYQVNIVDDVGRGFANEYRLVSMFKICQAVNATLYSGLFWPTPIP
jgi:hypothetical protein